MREPNLTNHARDVEKLVQAGAIHGDVHIHSSPASVAAAVVTRVRPQDTAGEVFVGRDDEHARVLAVLNPDTGDGGAVSGVVVAGMGGIGKTALAHHAAATAAGRGWFPGGVWWVDLRGYTPEGHVPAEAVVGPLLRHLGVPEEQIPDDPGTQAGAYQELLAQLAVRGRGVLLVCDNTSTSAQVRPLLPTGAGPHRVVVTTRDTLNLPRARRLTLDVLDAEDAITLLGQALGEHDPDDPRFAADPAGAEALARACGRLPLALRIAAGLLADESHLDPGELAAQLRAAPGVQGYTHGEQVLAAVFDRSWHRLLDHHPEWARLLRLLCLHPGPDISTDAAAALIGQPPDTVRVGLRGLRQAHLLQVTDPQRWGLHDLVRAHTSTHTPPALDPDHLHAARTRLLEHYATTADHADAHLRALPGQPVPHRFTGRAQALAWLDIERVNLVAAVSHAAATGHHYHAARLGNALAHYLHWRRHLADWVTVATHAHTNATHLGPHIRAAATGNLAIALAEVRRFEEAITVHRQVIDLFQELGDRHSEGMAWNNLGGALQQLRRFEEAITALRKNLAICQEVGNRHGEGMAWNNLGSALGEVQRIDEAITAHQKAIAIQQELGDRHGEGMAWNNLGLSLRQVQRIDEAITAHHKAIDLSQEVGDRHREGMAWNNLGRALRQLRRFEEAITAHQEDLAICQEVGDRHGEGAAWTNLGSALAEVQRIDEAITAHHKAIDLFQEVGDRHGEGMAWANLGLAQRQLDRFDEAAGCWEQARAAFTAASDTDRADSIDRLLHSLPPSSGKTDPT